jgi:hypothetical protein
MTVNAGLSQLITDIGGIWDFLIGKVADVFDLFLSEPILITSVGVILAYTIVKLVRKIF